MAELTGQYQNFSLIGKYIPILWILYTWCAFFLVSPTPNSAFPGHLSPIDV